MTRTTDSACPARSKLGESPTVPSVPGTVPGTVASSVCAALRSRPPHAHEAHSSVSVPPGTVSVLRRRLVVAAWRAGCGEGRARGFVAVPERCARGIRPRSNPNRRPSAPRTVALGAESAPSRCFQAKAVGLLAPLLRRERVSLLARALDEGTGGTHPPGAMGGGYPNADPIPRFAPRGVSRARGPNRPSSASRISRALRVRSANATRADTLQAAAELSHRGEGSRSAPYLGLGAALRTRDDRISLNIRKARRNLSATSPTRQIHLRVFERHAGILAPLSEVATGGHGVGTP
jgi:hypothetical protein